MKRLTWGEMVEYWRQHETRVHTEDFSDPDGLGNVCRVGAPIWLNQYYARFQRIAYEALLDKLPQATPTALALDVGCGTGRWCRLLAARGYRIVGIDLQPGLIARNRASHPDMTFVTVPIQDFHYAEPFDLVSSVTVLQHLPFDEQAAAIQRMRSLLKTGGHAIALENVSEQAEHVFSRRPAIWRKKFEDAGFRFIAMYRYDFSPALRLGDTVIGGGHGILRRIQQFRGESVSPDPQSRRYEGIRAINRLAKRVSLAADEFIEPVLVATQASLPARHCGFLFQAW